MDSINIRNALDTSKMTAREINITKGNTLIARNPNVKAEAMNRLHAVQDVKGMLQNQINRAGTQDMPQGTVELYEAIWIMLQDIEQAEAQTALGA